MKAQNEINAFFILGLVRDKQMQYSFGLRATTFKYSLAVRAPLNLRKCSLEAEMDDSEKNVPI